MVSASTFRTQIYSQHRKCGWGRIHFVNTFKWTKTDYNFDCRMVRAERRRVREEETRCDGTAKWEEIIWSEFKLWAWFKRKYVWIAEYLQISPFQLCNVLRMLRLSPVPFDLYTAFPSFSMNSTKCMMSLSISFSVPAELKFKCVLFGLLLAQTVLRKQFRR